jgi:hypothetical protein
MEKEIKLGEVGALVVKEEGGIASVKLSLTASIGGGEVAGALKGSVSAEVDLDAKILIDVGMELAAAKFPAVAGILKGAKAMIDKELASI